MLGFSSVQSRNARDFTGLVNRALELRTGVKGSLAVEAL